MCVSFISYSGVRVRRAQEVISPHAPIPLVRAFGEHRRSTSPDATSLSSTGDKPSRYFSDSFYNEG